ncbi:MAG TPA: GAF domain-containing protein [Blastocatellia bacterium]|nr:GAF domain-containing protein [Blastocatellia bacterium]
MFEEGSFNIPEEQLNNLILNLPVGVMALNPEGEILFVNEQAEKMLGLSANGGKGKNVRELFADTQEGREVVERLLSDDDSVPGYETPVIDSAGRLIPVRLSKTSLSDAGAQRAIRVICLHDLRESKDKEQKLEMLLEAGNIVSNAESLNQGLEKIAQLLLSLIPSTFCRVLIYDENEEYLEVRIALPSPSPEAQFHWDPAVGSRVDIDTTWSCLRSRLEEGKSEVIKHTDPEQDHNLKRLAFMLQINGTIEYLLTVPLTVDNKIVGLLDLGRVEREGRAASEGRGPYTEREINLATDIAAHTTVRIDRLRLHEITERQMKLLEALDEASQHIRVEKETTKLMHAVNHLATRLVGCDKGALLVHLPYVGEVQLVAVSGLGKELVGTQKKIGQQSLLRSVIHDAKVAIINNDPIGIYDDALLDLLGFKSLIAIPVIPEQGGKVEAVLVVGDDKGAKHFTQDDSDILVRFAKRASIALHTSELLSLEQHRFSQFKSLLETIECIQQETDWDNILHIVLTVVTANYGLGFNRAAILWLDERGECLVGRSAIGHLLEKEALESWTKDRQEGLTDFSQYIRRLRAGAIEPTSLGEKIRDLRFPVISDKADNLDAFSEVVRSRRPLCIREFHRLPKSFIDTFDLKTELAAVPIMARDQVVGLLVADNKFTNSPITDQDLESLKTFASIAGLAIEVEGQRLRSYFGASSFLVMSDNPEHMAGDIIQRMREAAKAMWVGLILIDSLGQARTMITTQETDGTDFGKVIQPDGISMRVMSTGEAEAIEDVDKHQGDTKEIVFHGLGTRSALCLPMLLQGKKIGVAWLHYNKPRHFPKFEIDALQFYVNQVAIAFDSARRYERLEKLRTAIEVLSQVGNAQEMPQKIALAAKDVLGADAATILFYDANHNVYTLDKSATAGLTDKVLDSIAGRVQMPAIPSEDLNNSEWISDIFTWEHEYCGGKATREVFEKAGIRSLAIVPLKAITERPCVLCVGYNQLRVFSDEDKRNTETFANHASLALKNSMLINRLTKTSKTAEAIAKKMVQGNIRETLESIVRGTKEVMRCDAVVLFIYDQWSDRFHSPPTLEGVRFPDKMAVSQDTFYGSIIRIMLAQDGPYAADNVAEDSFFKDRPFVKDEEIISCMAIPLKAESGKVGVMFVNYRSSHTFTADDLTTIKPFADFAAVAIRSAELLEEQKNKAAEQQWIHELSQAIVMTASFNLEDSQNTLNRVLERIAGSLMTEYCAIVLKDERDNLRIVAAAGWEKELINREGLLGTGNRSQTGYTLQTRKVVVVEDYDQESPFQLPDFMRKRKIRSGMSVPIFEQGTPIGVLIVHSVNVRHFTYKDTKKINLLELFANQMAMLVHIAQQYEQIERQNLDLKAVYDAIKAINASTVGSDLDRMLNIILEQAVECIVGKEGKQWRRVVLGTIQLLDEKKKKLVFRSVYSNDPSSLKSIEIGSGWEVDENAKDVGITGAAFLSNKPQLVHNVKEDGRYKEFNSKTVSELSVPIVDRDNPIGVLDVESDQEAAFDEADVKTLQGLAELVVMAIQSAEHFKELQKTKVVLGARHALAWFGMSGAILHHTSKANAVNINDQVDIIKFILAQPNTSERTGRILSSVELIKEEADKILKEADEIMKEPEGVTGLQNLDDLIRGCVRRTWQSKSFSAVTPHLELEPMMVVRASSIWINRVLDVFIMNACQAMSDSNEKILTITGSKRDGWAEVEFKDTGPGMADEVWAKLLEEPITRTDGSKKSGVGLLMAQLILEKYQGLIEKVSNTTSGTTLRMRLPLEP